jgi:hypothetical protein
MLHLTNNSHFVNLAPVQDVSSAIVLMGSASAELTDSRSAGEKGEAEDLGRLKTSGFEKDKGKGGFYSNLEERSGVFSNPDRIEGIMMDSCPGSSGIRKELTSIKFFISKFKLRDAILYSK